MRKFVLLCQRGDESISFGWRWPLWLEDVDGLTEADFEVQTEKASGQDGEYYKGSTAKKRNIIIYAWIKENHFAMRDKLYSFFQPRKTGTLYVTDGDVTRKIDYKPELVRSEPIGQRRKVTISLICPDPLFKAIVDDRVDMATWQGLIEWPDDIQEIPDEPFEMETMTNTLVATIENPSNVSRGLTVRFAATGTVINPSLLEVQSQKGLKVTVEMHAGDVLTVTTGLRNKRVTLYHAGLEQSANNLWVYGSTWLQAEPGDNVFRYDADSGIDNLEVTISSTPAYWGV